MSTNNAKIGSDIEVVSWAQTHIEFFPDHTTVTTADTPSFCETCGDKSPAYMLSELGGAPLYGYNCEVVYTTTISVPVAAYNLEEAHREGFFAVAAPDVQVSDVRLYPVDCCQVCRAVSEEHAHAEGEEGCTGEWLRDSSYDI